MEGCNSAKPNVFIYGFYLELELLKNGKTDQLGSGSYSRYDFKPNWKHKLKLINSILWS